MRQWLKLSSRMNYRTQSPVNVSDDQRTGSAPLRMKSWKRLRELLLEVLFAVVGVTAGIIYVAGHPTANQHWDLITLVGNTAIIFGFLISWFRGAWKRLVFWTVLIVMFLGHTAVYLFVLRRIQDFPLAYYVVLNPIELFVFISILQKATRDDNQKHKTSL
jgi:hypothetical protein